MSGRECVPKAPVCAGCGGSLEEGDLSEWVYAGSEAGWKLFELCAECEGLLDYSLDDVEEP